jgi:clathrin heavy chain
MLYACYDLVPLATVMEISWRHGLNDFTMPFMISLMSQQAATIEQLRKDNEERKEREASQQKTDDTTPIIGGRLMLTQGPVNPQPTGYGHTNGITPQPTGFPRAF